MYIANQPVVALTLRFDRIDWFWFTLMHEVAHIALGHKRGHLDFLDDSSSDDEDEAAANQLASDALLSTSAITAFARDNRGPTSRAAIEKFAEHESVHAGIVIGRLHYLGLLPYSHLRGYLEKVAHHLGPWTDG